MHVNAKRIVFLGLLVAFSVLLVVLSGIIEINTIFLLALASFGTSIAIREFNLRIGIGYTIASTALSFLLAVNKLYVITYLCMCLYLILTSAIFNICIKMNVSYRLHKLYLLMKYVVFNVLYIPMLIISPKLIYAGLIDRKILLILFIGGQVALYIYDAAHDFFQNRIWSKYRNKIMDIK